MRCGTLPAISDASGSPSPQAADPEFIAQYSRALAPAARRAPLLNVHPTQQKSLSTAYRVGVAIARCIAQADGRPRKSVKKLGIVTAMVLEEKPGYARPATYIRERGSFMSKGDVVYANIPSALNPMPKDAMPNRLGLAEWLVSDDNPLTARVAVNHFWEALFGHGIVETSEDFGTQGDPPSHPELLDWLATEFMQQGWSMKKIQRLIVTSATYRQSRRSTRNFSHAIPTTSSTRDGPRFRVEAEMVHDIALSASGLLSAKCTGPAFSRISPKAFGTFPTASDKWVESEGEDRYRRAIYTFMRRSAPYPSLATSMRPAANSAPCAASGRTRRCRR